MIEIIPVEKLDAEITVPGSKYIANRILVIAALANGVSKIKNVPENDDVNSAINALTKLGIGIKKENDTLEISGCNGKINYYGDINVEESGTLLRFIIGVSAIVSGKVKITGAKRIQERPIEDLIKSLQELGVTCNSVNGCPPVDVEGGSFNGGTTKIKGDVSSQFISSLLIIAPFAKDDVEILVEGNLVSKNYIDMTIDVMEMFSVIIERDGYKSFKIKSGQEYKAIDMDIPGDWSSANYFFGAAAIVPGTVKINNLDMESKQGESKFVHLLSMMGCEVTKGNDFVKVKGHKKLRGMDIDMGDMPDAVQTLAAVTAFADEKTKITNIKHLKFKESDRIKDTEEEFKKLGVNIKSSDNEILIEKNELNGGEVETHNDHRMAMSLALIGLKVPGVKIKDPESVNKSFPGYWDKLKEIGVEIKNV